MQISKVSSQVQKTLLMSKQIYKILGILNDNFRIRRLSLAKMTKSLRKKTLQTNKQQQTKNLATFAANRDRIDLFEGNFFTSWQKLIW
jgi:L-cystine uptake protein TcyP (sodium:dicarboxylate symporter family)